MDKNHIQHHRYAIIDKIKSDYDISDRDIVSYLLTHGTFAKDKLSDNLDIAQINRRIESLYKSKIIPKEFKSGLIDRKELKSEKKTIRYDLLASLMERHNISYEDMHNYILTNGIYFESDPTDFTFITMILNVNTLYNEQIIPDEVRDIWVHRVPDNRIKEEGKDTDTVTGISK